MQRPVASAINVQKSAIWIAAATLVTAVALSAGTARAESTFISGAGTATARLNFSIVIPKFVFLQVGTGTSLASNPFIDPILFDMTLTPTAVGNGTARRVPAATCLRVAVRRASSVTISLRL